MSTASKLFFGLLLVCLCFGQHVEFSGTVQFNNDNEDSPMQLRRIALVSAINYELTPSVNINISPDNAFQLTSIVPDTYYVFLSFNSSLSFCYRYNVGKYELTESKTNQVITITFASLTGIIQDSISSAPVVNATLSGSFTEDFNIQCGFRAVSDFDGSYFGTVIQNKPYNFNIVPENQETYPLANGFSSITFSALTNTHNFKLSQGVQVTGELVFASDGVPVDRATIFAYSLGTNIVQGGWTATDENGSFSMFLPMNQTLTLNGTLTLPPPTPIGSTKFYVHNYFYGTVKTTHSAMSVLFNVYDSQMEITVTDEAGNPVPNIRFQAASYNVRPQYAIVEATGVTGSSGKIAIRTLPYDFDFVSVYPTSISSVYVATPGPSGQLSATPYVINTAIDVSGTIYFSNGDMVQGGAIEQGIAGSRSTDFVNGTYATNFTSGDYPVAILSVWRTDYSFFEGLYVSELSLSTSSNAIDWKVPVVTISGYVVNTTGNPVPFAIIHGAQNATVMNWPSNFFDFQNQVIAQTDENGYFSFICSPGHYYQVSVSPTPSSSELKNYYGMTPIPSQLWTADASNLKYTIM